MRSEWLGNLWPECLWPSCAATVAGASCPSSGWTRVDKSFARDGEEFEEWWGLGQDAPATAGLGQDAPATAGLGQDAPATGGLGQDSPATAGLGQDAPATSALVIAICVLAFAGQVFGQSTIRSDEQVLFFPTVAHFDEAEKEWLVPIHGWIFEPQENSIVQRTILRSIRSALGDNLDGDSDRRLRQRLGRFMVDNERDKRLQISIGDQTFSLDPSDPDGHFQARLRVPVELVERVRDGKRLPFRAVTRKSDDRTFASVATLLQPQGLLVISDIDDTVKVTEVRDKKRMLENTLLKPFQAVAGMPEIYRQWAESGAEFVYVSGSPWQLFPPLSEFLEADQYPLAAIELRRFRLKDLDVAAMLSSPESYKLETIRRIIDDFPMRELIMVGDSADRDPEVYGQLAREYPEKTRRILIRNVTDEEEAAPRYAAAFRDLPRELWQVYTSVDAIRLDGEARALTPVGVGRVDITPDHPVSSIARPMIELPLGSKKRNLPRAKPGAFRSVHRIGK